jgi:hypothetical protein
MQIMIIRKWLALMHNAWDALDLTEILCSSYIIVLSVVQWQRATRAKSDLDDVTARIHSC